MAELPETFVPGFHDENEIKKMKYFKFGNTGMSVSQLSLGTGGFSPAYGNYTLEECKATVHEALKKGINYIDTAYWYGHGISEEILGKCLEGIPRKAYYLATKIARYEKEPKLMFDFSAEKTRESIDASLKRLKLDYIDVLQVHDIEFAPSLKIVLEETLPVLKEALDQGKTKFIGVTGYPVSVLADCIKQSTVKIDSVLCYTRLSMLNNTLKEYLPFFKSKNLGIVNAAPHCLGLLSSAGPPEWHPGHQDIKDVCTEAREYCKKNGVELGRLALYYALHEDGPHTNLVGMNRRDILNCNLDVYYNGITDKEKEIYYH
ncbi:L-galactose dehydrogenase, partial [Asbolus verrucosus]